MTKADPTHFDTYRIQNKVKHQIFTKYLSAYLSIIRSWDTDIFVIDGFAGRGHYGDPDSGESFAGSPILTLQEIARNEKLRKVVNTWFIESNEDYFDNLSSSVSSFMKVNKGLIKPILEHAKFTDALGPLLKEIDSKGSAIKPTFLFVDPCGVEGVSFEVISSVIKHPGCEALIFFNYMGVSRICGLLTDKAATPTLINLFGNSQRVAALRQALLVANTPARREEVIVAHYLAALRSDALAKYIIPFRIEQESRRATSHYLIHTSKHPKGFKVMKSVMWGQTRQEDDFGRLELLQASKNDTPDLFKAELQQIDGRLLGALGDGGPCRAGELIDELISDPNDLFDEKCYKTRLSSLEEDGLIVVFDVDGKTPKPAASRLRKERGSDRRSPHWGANLVISLA